MIKFLTLQYRRLAFGTFFLFLAGLVMFSENDWPIWGMGLIAALFALIMLVLAAIGITLFPRFRTVYEMLGVLFLLIAVIDRLAPNVLDMFGDIGRVIAFAVLFSVVEYYLYGAGQHKLPAPAKWTGVSRFSSTDSLEDLWSRLVPDPADPKRHYTGRLKEMTHGETEGQYRVMWHSGGSTFTVQDIEVTENQPLEKFSYRFGGLVSASNAPMHSGTWTVTLEPGAGDTTEITITETIERTRLGTALFLWFDNFADQITEHAAATFAGRKDRSIFRLIDQYIEETG